MGADCTEWLVIVGDTFDATELLAAACQCRFLAHLELRGARFSRAALVAIAAKLDFLFISNCAVVDDAVLRGLHAPALRHVWLRGLAVSPETIGDFVAAHPRLQSVGVETFAEPVLRAVPGGVYLFWAGAAAAEPDYRQTLVRVLVEVRHDASGPLPLISMAPPSPRIFRARPRTWGSRFDLPAEAVGAVRQEARTKLHAARLPLVAAQLPVEGIPELILDMCGL
jgi:hypothetical protein